MDKYERRRLRLKELIASLCEGKQATLAHEAGIDPTYVSRLLYPEGKAGRKRMAEGIRDQIEDAFHLPRGWLDLDPGTPIERPIRQPADHRVEEPVQKVAPAPQWPFRRITPEQWAKLSVSDTELVEGMVELLLRRMDSRVVAGQGPVWVV